MQVINLTPLQIALAAMVRDTSTRHCHAHGVHPERVYVSEGWWLEFVEEMDKTGNHTGLYGYDPYSCPAGALAVSGCVCVVSHALDGVAVASVSNKKS